MSAEIMVFFLTDVEGSTRLWEQHGAKMPEVVDHLDAVVESVVRDHGGLLEKERGEGDSHFVVFRQATSATRAAAELQRRIARDEWPHGIRPDVRIGLHAGEALRRGLDYAGLAVHRAARLRSVAHGRQVVASRVLVDLIPGELDELQWVHLGMHRVRDFPGWTDIFQLCAPFLQRAFPSLSTLDTGLPPVCTIVFMDADGLLHDIDKLSQEDENALFAMFAELFASSFARARGQYLQFQGDGCLALFADPQAALQFARDARLGSRMLGYEMRGVLHLGHVEFAFGVPYGRSLRIAGTMIRRGIRGAITLSASAAAVIELEDDLVLYPPSA